MSIHAQILFASRLFRETNEIASWLFPIVEPSRIRINRNFLKDSRKYHHASDRCRFSDCSPMQAKVAEMQQSAN
jgi:hypothetical protein